MTWDFFHETTRTFMSFVTSHGWEKTLWQTIILHKGSVNSDEIIKSKASKHNSLGLRRALSLEILFTLKNLKLWDLKPPKLMMMLTISNWNLK